MVVFVHTYAIVLSLKANQRVIYTIPSNALSYQKFREFSDVGLMTGDVSINPTTSCLIMTTEILRSLLYKGSEVMSEVEWVLLDEIQYMRDKQRGVVWKATIILLLHNVHYVFLSATIPNALQFVVWIIHLHQQPCHIVYTDFRHPPSRHYIFPVGGSGIRLMVDEHGRFREEHFTTAMGKNLALVIVFSFSKKGNEAYALQVGIMFKSIWLTLHCRWPNWISTLLKKRNL